MSGKKKFTEFYKLDNSVDFDEKRKISSELTYTSEEVGSKIYFCNITCTRLKGIALQIIDHIPKSALSDVNCWPHLDRLGFVTLKEYARVNVERDWFRAEIYRNTSFEVIMFVCLVELSLVWCVVWVAVE